MKKNLFFIFIMMFGWTLAQVSPEGHNENPSNASLSEYVQEFTKDIHRFINLEKVSKIGKNLSAKVKFSVNEKYKIEENSLKVEGSQPEFNEEIKRIIVPIFATWNPPLPTTTTLTRRTFEFPIQVTSD